MSFGSGFGSGPFGSASPPPPVLQLKQLAANLMAISGFGGGLAMALHAKNWSVTPLDPDAHARLVQSTDQVTNENHGRFALPQLALVTLPVMLIATDGVLTYGRRYRISFNGQIAEFTALLVATSAAPADVRSDDGFIWDIANPFLPRDALVFPPSLGTYQVTEAGDLGVDKSGEASLRKRIVRRVLSASGSFFHLQGYGVGVELKSLVSVDQLRRLSARLRAQVLLEPEVQSVTVFLTQTPQDPSVINCAVNAETQQGVTHTVVPIRLP